MAPFVFVFLLHFLGLDFGVGFTASLRRTHGIVSNPSIRAPYFSKDISKGRTPHFFVGRSTPLKAETGVDDDEIQRLADSISEIETAIEEISNKSSNIEKDINSTNGEIEMIVKNIEGVESSLTPVEEALEKAEEALKNVEEALENVEEALENIGDDDWFSNPSNHLLLLKENTTGERIDYLQEKDNSLREEKNYLRVKENSLRVKENSLREEKNNLQVKENSLQVKENSLREEKNNLQVKENNLQEVKKRLGKDKELLEAQKEKEAASARSDGRVQSLTFKIDEKILQKGEFIRFAERVNEMFGWWEEEMTKVWIAPYFPIVQSSGTGKTKIMSTFCDESRKDGADAMATGMTSFLILCYRQSHKDPDLGGVFNGTLRVPTQKRDQDREDIVAQLDEIVSAAKTERVVLLLDEAQHLLREDGWHFRCVRWWLRLKNPKHNKQVVLVLAGTTSQLARLREEPPESSSSRNPDLTLYHDEGTALLAPFYQIYTTGLYKKKQDYALPPNSSEFEKSVKHGRPLFAAMLESDRQDFWAKQSLIFQKLLISSVHHWSQNSLAKLSILGVRLQLGQTSLKVASDLVARGYASLTAFIEESEFAQVAFTTDPVLARLSMCLMIPEYRGNEIPPNTKNEENSNDSVWAQHMAEVYSKAISLPDKGDLGEIGAALYMLQCGDALRYAADSLLQTFSVSLNRFLVSMSNLNEVKECVEGDLSLNFIQVTRDSLRYRDIISSFPFSDWHLQDLYESGCATYACNNQEAYDFLVPLRRQGQGLLSSKEGQGNNAEGYEYLPMLVSAKNRATFGAKESTDALLKMKDMIEKEGVGRGVGVLFLVGLQSPQSEKNRRKKYESSLVNATNIPNITYDNQVSVQQEKLQNGIGLFIIVVPEKDKFGINDMLISSAVAEGEGDVHVSNVQIKNHAFKFAEEDYQGKEMLLLLSNQAKKSKAAKALFELINEEMW